MRGFSLIEALVAVAIGALILAGAAQVAATGLKASHHTRRMFAAKQRVDGGQRALERLVRRLEPEFWSRWPLQARFVHGGGTARGGAQFHAACEDSPADACVVLWDIRPTAGPPLIYQIDDGGDYPHSLAISPIDVTYPVGPAEDIGRMSVMAIRGNGQTFCALVLAAAGAGVALAAPEHQPWRLPRALSANNHEAVHLGTLEVVHCGLVRDGANRKLAFQPWTLDDRGWRPKRRTTVQTGLSALTWVSHEGEDLLVLSARLQRARALAEPTLIGERRFDEEAAHAVLAF